MIQGIINNVIPVGKDGKPLRLDYQEKLDLIFTGNTELQEKIKEALKVIDDLERFADHLDGQLTWMTTKELKKSLQKIRDILEK
tara:strand:- start:473 stop:724 length:252 start_codon:yes stop_codon:yes gene_type:complete